MEQVTTIGLDIAKSVFQVHGVSSEGLVDFRRRVRRSDLIRFFSSLPRCLVGIEAFPGAHHWARALGDLGHEIRLMPAAYVKPYVKRQKKDTTDAEAICAAETQPTMRFVPVKSTEQQSVLNLHRSRDLSIRQRTGLANAMRGHLAEFGIVVVHQPGLGGSCAVSIDVDRGPGKPGVPSRTALSEHDRHRRDGEPGSVVLLPLPFGSR